MSEYMLRGDVEQLREFEDGWGPEGGKVIDPRAIEVAQTIAEKHDRHDLDITPRADGGVSVSWTAGEIELEIWILPSGAIGDVMTWSKRTRDVIGVEVTSRR